MNNTILFNEFFVEGENQEISHVLLHVIQPSTPSEEKEKGYFFAVCEINNGNKDDIFNLQTLMDRVENEYYETPNVPGKNTLETILEKINREGFTLSRPETDLSCLIGVLKESDLTFSFCGQPESLLFYKNKSEQYQTMDLVAQNEGEQEDEKLFSQIIQGKISPGDYFFGGTGHIASCFNHDRLQKIITGGRTAEQSAVHFEKVLSGIRNGYSFGGFIIHVAATPSRLKTVDKSIEDKKMLYDTERQTAKTLTPSLLGNLNTKVKSMMNNNEDEDEDEYEEESGKNVIETSEPPKTHVSTLVTKTQTKPYPNKTLAKPSAEYAKIILKGIWIGLRYIGMGIYWLFFMLAKIIINIGRFVIMLGIVATNFKNRRRAILESWTESWHHFTRWFKNLPLLTKILALASIVFAVVFMVSVFYLQTEKNRAENDRIYRESLQTIKNKIDAAESSSIYGDEVQAKTILEEARTLIAQFVCRPIDNAACNDFTDRLNKLGSKLRKMETLSPNLIIDFNNQGYSGYEKFLKIENKILVFSANTSTVLVYDIMTKETKALTLSDGSLSGFICGAVPKENDYAALIGADKKSLAIFDPKNITLKTGGISYSGEPDIRAIAIYNRRLYSLDAAANQIYRHDNINAGFGLGRDWISEQNLNLRDGVDITIDGDLYILKENGEILKFNKGIPQPINLEIVDPTLNSGDEIWTYTDLANIYILDSVNKRMIIFDKTGKFLRQLTADEFSSPTSADIEEAAGLAYILDQSKLYEIKLK